MRRNYATPKDFESRFWRHVDRSGDGCWEWVGSRREHGYGQVNRHGKIMKAHRAAWELVNGPIPEAMNVLHSCDNPPCCNPAHLFLGSMKDNTHDMMAKGRNSPPPRLLGERHHRAKLTEDQVRYIRQCGLRTKALMEMFGISRTAVQHIRSGRVWKHVT